MKAYVQRIQKMWYFLGLAVFKVEFNSAAIILAAEVGSKFKKNDGKAALKKKTRPQL